MSRQVGVFVLFASCVLVFGIRPSRAEGQINECKDAKGNTVYQDGPCVETVPAATKPNAATKPKAAPKPKAASRPAAVSKPKSATPLATAGPATPRADASTPVNRSIDVRWATPEKAVRTFVAAIQAGDRALALSCLTATALSELGPDAGSLPLEELRETVRPFTGYVSEGEVGPYWSIRALRAGMRPKWIFLERAASGEWKIGAI